MATPRSAWGIDVGNRALKAVHLIRSGDGVKIDDFEIIEHEHVLSEAGDNRDAMVQSALANFVQRHSIKGSSVAVGVSGQSSFARFIKLPPVEPKKIPEIVRFEAIQQIPFPLEDVEWSYQLFRDDQSPDVEVGIFAMRRELVNQHIAAFTQMGMNVEVVQMHPLAVYNAMYHDQRLKGPTMIIDVGAENTDLIIAEGETIWLRSIPIGGNRFTESLVKNFKLKFPKAEELKRNAATSKYGRQILQAMRPVFADLVSEIQRSIGFYSSVHRESRITRVLTLGGTFRLPGLQKYLQQNLQLELARVDHLEAGNPNDARLAAAFNENILSSVGAYGLALQAMGEAKITSSLLPQTIRRERMWREKTKWFAAAAAVFIAGTGIVVGKYYFDDMQVKQDMQANGAVITDTLRTAQNLDRQWRTVEDSGLVDRKLIANVNSLVQSRDVWNHLVPALYSVFQPPTSKDPKQITATPRDQRREVVLDRWSSEYVDDMGPVLGDSEAEFIHHAAGASSGGGIPAWTAPSPSRGPGPGPGPGPMFGPPMMGGMPMRGARSNAGPPKAAEEAKERGFLLTIRCITPNARGSQYVAETVVAALRGMNNHPEEGFSIARIALVSESKRGADKTGFSSPSRGNGRFKPLAPVVPPGGPGLGGVGMPQGPGGFMGGRPPTGTNANVPTEETDPLTGESIAKDTVVTILAAVVIDPPLQKAATKGQLAEARP